MIYLIHEKAPTIDASLESQIFDTKLVLNEVNRVLQNDDDIQIIRGDEKVLKILDAILPESIYVEDFLSDEYIPTAKSLGLRCASLPYEKFITLLALDSKLDNTEQALKDIKTFHKNKEMFKQSVVDNPFSSDSKIAEEEMRFKSASQESSDDQDQFEEGFGDD